MKIRILLAAAFSLALLAAGLAWRLLQQPFPSAASSPPVVIQTAPAAPPAIVSDPVTTAPATATVPAASTARATIVENPPAAAGRLERLDGVRQKFRELATGDPRTALAAARNLEDEGERETALTTLMTVWKQGDLSSVRQRAGIISQIGLDAGVGVELASDPGLGLLYAEGLTNLNDRAEVIKAVGYQMLRTNGAAAMALLDQLPAESREQSFNIMLQAWASSATEDALAWARSLPDAAQRDAAIGAIREVAPVGIGTQLSVQDGITVIGKLMPGAPAELSGQLHPGDRIVGIAQGDSVFVDARNLPLNNIVQAIRGSPGTIVQLQIVPADAPPDSLPRTVAITRDQVKYKQ
jgi:hypothetical protein